ncbi:MAG: hypothetical protein ACYCZY_11255 [Lacisediminihabitans sp.]
MQLFAGRAADAERFGQRNQGIGFVSRELAVEKASIERRKVVEV